MDLAGRPTGESWNAASLYGEAVDLTIGYDNRGRRTSVNSSMAGEVTLNYDSAHGRLDSIVRDNATVSYGYVTSSSSA